MTPAARVLHVFATFVPAGPQVRTTALLGGLGDAFEHEVIAMDGRTEAMATVPAGARVTLRELAPLPGPGGHARALRRLLARERPDLLCTYNWGSFDALLAARSLGLRHHLHHEDGFNADEVVRRKARRNLARRAALGRAHAVVVPSRVLQGVAQREWGVPADRVAFVVNGVDVEAFRPAGPGRAELRAELSIPADALVVGAVGHLRPVKRFDRLVRACAALPADLGAGTGVHLVLVGDGAERAALEDLARTHLPPGGRVHFAGHRTDLAPVYRAFDLFAISSDSEQLPVSLLEAMACGLCAVGTDVGDVRATLAESERGGVVPVAEDHAGLARVLAEALRDPTRRAAGGAANRERVREHYSLAAMVARYRALYDAARRRL